MLLCFLVHRLVGRFTIGCGLTGLTQLTHSVEQASTVEAIQPLLHEALFALGPGRERSCDEF